MILTPDVREILHKQYQQHIDKQHKILIYIKRKECSQFFQRKNLHCYRSKPHQNQLTNQY